MIRLNNRRLTFEGGSLLGCVFEDVITPFGLALTLEGSLGRPFVSAAINGEREGGVKWKEQDQRLAFLRLLSPDTHDYEASVLEKTDRYQKEQILDAEYNTSD